MWTALVFAVFVCISLGDLTEVVEKRAQTCTYVASGNPAQQWPKACASDPSGAYCLSSGKCGCLRDADCFSNTATPYCDVASSTCFSCMTSTSPSSGLNVDDHYWCRDRYPSIYVVDSQTGPTLDVSTESVAPANYYREVCLPVDGGSCARCNQAAAENGVTGVDFPDYDFPDQASKDAGWGTVFCNYIRGADSDEPGRPICATAQTWEDVGLADKVDLDQLWVEMDVGNVGDEGPASVGNTGVYVGDEPLAEGSDSQQNVDLTQPLINWDGACVPCQLFDGTESESDPVEFHALCYWYLENMPICDEEGAGCRACESNVECGYETDDCFNDGTASCTGGGNCYKSGECFPCESDDDCQDDGGETPDQGTCNLDTGLCVDAFSCLGNFDEGTAADCPDEDFPNCMDDGTCIFCDSNADCGSDDLHDDQVCYDDGICGDCVINDDCIGTTGANCWKDGSCDDCLSDDDCGDDDGGLPESGNPGKCASSGYCSDDEEQELCNPVTNVCEDPCLSNEWCGDRDDYWNTGGGANCYKDGTCDDCGTAAANSNNCGSIDGPDMSLDGAEGVANEPDCGNANICITPFECDVNDDCGTGEHPGANCQSSGACLNCQVTHSTSTCSSADGGEVDNQPNCWQSTRICVDECETNADCVGTQGQNCMDSGLCLDCRNDDDCADDNDWNGDGGETPNQSICDDGICVDACDGNFGQNTDNPCTNGFANCMDDGYCRDCDSDSDCVSNDGPPGRGDNDVCGDNGICIDPFTCGNPGPSSLDNEGCQDNYGNNGYDNCWDDGTCETCTNNQDCYDNDGGKIPNQPRCDSSSGECDYCQSNSDCPAEAANCHEDGFCYDCRKLTNQCGDGVDGPPGTSHPNPNCDSLTGICVDFCTLDEHCPDDCAPYCQLERGCCVECLEDEDCPLQQWRGDEADKTECSGDRGYICIEPSPECSHDSDCSGSTPACSLATDTCVECVFDAHCGDSTPACATNRHTCVECTYDGHCDDGDECLSDNTCSSNNNDQGAAAAVKVDNKASSAVTLASGFSLLLAAVLAILF